MKQMQEHKKYMHLVLDMAKKGKDFVFPNPMVGAILVKDNKIISKGYHKYFGAEHAEAQAINFSKTNVEGSTLYVNLEPCNNWGKCPPCVDLIIKSKIKTVVFAMKDPNPLTSGKSLKKLKSAGITVISGILEQQAEKLNKQYINHITKVKPYIVVKTAMSLDGKIASYTGDSKWISNEKSRSFVHKLRTNFDAILVGTNTVLKDNPVLSSHNKGKNPVRVVLDEKLKTPSNYNVVDGKIPTIILYDENIKKTPVYLNKSCIKLVPINFNKAKKDFNIVIEKLNKMALKRILVEGGGEINASILKTGKVNEVIIFIAPIIVGGRTAKTFVEGAGAKFIKDSLKFKKINIKKFDNDVVIFAKK
ncbi:bifunctional diaminohydroxyphosphoribosylaminopyrimidine deaminase/5-amino-6-(5-phosphoribosylamino)uracil reductase RibD [Candidatus Ruminimicrobium bovinum]|uniref:bifunctional diaminohydroxyphosphoribosylaminopyrimidine deaminase/5-amino-6-(5-phosphoribosylamino)uracil reductase RibD n=1 Tax=Candidatus Ruminimicrobium bovinum TaxID=3242779 RepID=UPI0039B8DC59